MKIEITYNDKKQSKQKEFKTFIELKEFIFKNLENIESIFMFSENFKNEELTLGLLCKEFEYIVKDKLQIINSGNRILFRANNIDINLYSEVRSKIGCCDSKIFKIKESSIALSCLNKNGIKKIKEKMEILKLLEKEEQNFKISIIEKEDWIKISAKDKDILIQNSISAVSNDNISFSSFNSYIYRFFYKTNNKLTKIPFETFSLNENFEINNERNSLMFSTKYDMDKTIKRMDLYNINNNNHFLGSFIGSAEFCIETNDISLYIESENSVTQQQQIQFLGNILDMIKTLSFYIEEKNCFQLLEKILKAISKKILELKKEEKSFIENEKKYNNILNKVKNIDLNLEE